MRLLMTIGSAPLVWGTCMVLTPPAIFWRFSPTGVGNVVLKYKPILRGAVQPHWCGERKTARCVAFVTGGSAPLVWGTSLRLCRFTTCLRFSPTGVGNVVSND